MTSAPTRTSASNLRNQWLLLHGSFILIGVITTLLGPLLPSFSHHWSLSFAQVGFFFTTQYFGSFLGVVLTSVWLPRYGFSKVTAAGFVGFVLGFAFLGIGSWTLAAILVGVNGFGYGLANPSINLRATQLPSKNIAAAVTLLNFSWSLGAVLCPIFVGLLIPRIALRGFCIVLAVLSLIFFILHLSLRTRSDSKSGALSTHSLSEWLARLRVPQAMPLLVLFFLYVGVEVALGGWVATQEKNLPGMSTVAVMWVPSFFYGLLLFGRGVAPLALHRFTQLAISIGGLLLATLGTAIVALSNTTFTLYAGAAMTGFGLAPQFPIFVTWLAVTFGEDANWIGALFFGAGSLGAAALPWMFGVIATQSHSLRAGFYLPLLATIVMALLVLRARPDATH